MNCAIFDLSQHKKLSNHFGGGFMKSGEKTERGLKSHILLELKKRLKKPLTDDQIKVVQSVLEDSLNKKHIFKGSSTIPFFRKYYLLLAFGVNQRARKRKIMLDRRHAVSLKKYFYFLLLMSSGILICTYISLLWVRNLLIY